MALVSLSVTIGWLIYAIIGYCANKGSLSDIAPKLVITNWIAAIAFATVPLYTFMHCRWLLENVENENKNVDFIYDFKTRSMHLWLRWSSVFYFFGKFLLYIVLYLRLVYLLKDSLFSYNEKTYHQMRCAISAPIVFAIVNYAIQVFIGENIIGYLFAILYILCDICIPLTFNVMFIRKMNEINEFIHVGTLKMMQFPSDSQSTTNHDNKNKNIDINITVNSRPCESKSHNEKEINTNTKTDSKQANSAKLQEESTKIDTVSIITNVSKMESKKDQLHFLSVVARVTLLSVLITISSLMVFVIVGLYVAIHSEIVTCVMWISIAIDSFINTICLVLYFEFAKPMYNLFCCCCSNSYCVVNFLPKYLSCFCCR